MVGIGSLADSVTGDETAASGIGRNFRRGRRGKPRLYSEGIFGRDSRMLDFGGRCGLGFSGFGFGGFQLLGRRRIEDTAGERTEGRLSRWENLGLGPVLGGVDLGFDLGSKFVRGAAELVHEAADLAADLGQFLGAEKDQRQEKQEHHLAGKPEIHTAIIMRAGAR